MYIEVAITLIFFCFTLEEAVTANFILYRTCYVLMGFNQSDCALLGTSTATNETTYIEEKVQPVASVILMTNKIVGIVIPILLSFIIGPWSNKHGRKPFLLLSFTGYLIAYIIMIVLSSFDHISPWWWLWSCIALSLGGGTCSMLTMCFCYISDITTESNRTIRMGIFDILIMIGALIGLVSSSYVFAAFGYIGTYSICAFTSFLAVLYIKIFIKESVLEIDNEGCVQDLFNLSVVYKSFRICFKRRQNKDRTILCLLTAVLAIFVFVVMSDGSVFFLYAREKFHWSLRKYTLYLSSSLLIGIFGMLFALYFLNKFLQIKDIIIMIFISIFYMISSTMVGLATTDWHIYLAAVIKCMGGVTGPLTRSAISKVIPPKELGNVFSITTSLEYSAQLISGPFYTYIYNKTLPVHPNTYNFISAVMHGVNVVIIGSVLMLQKLYPVTMSYAIYDSDI